MNCAMLISMSPAPAKYGQKRKQAFELFDQGYGPTSPEVKKLKLVRGTRYNYYLAWKQEGGDESITGHPADEVEDIVGGEEEEGVGEGELSSEKQPKGKVAKSATTTASGASTQNLNQALGVRFQPKIITCGLTPIMVMGRQAAINEWDWPQDISLEDFLDTVIYHFFKDRDIILQGYVVTSNRNNGNENELAEALGETWPA